MSETPDKKVKNEYDLENLKGVGPVTAKNMIEAGITSIHDVVVRGPVNLKEVTGWTLDEAAEVVKEARHILELSGWLKSSLCSATELLMRRKDIKHLKTGSEELDNLFTGGVESDAVTEVYGEFGSGKTQLMHSLAVMVQLPEDRGGLDGGVLYIDTENTFRPERIISIAKAKKLDPVKVLDRIIVARAHNSSHQVMIMESAGEVILEHKIKLVIIDSIMGNFRPEFIGRGTLSERQQLLNKHVHILLRTCENYHLVGAFTNQALANPDGGPFAGDPTRATGGNIIAHASTYRIKLAKSGKNRIASMIDSPMHAFSQAKFTVTDGGVQDTDDYKPKKNASTYNDEMNEVIAQIKNDAAKVEFAITEADKKHPSTGTVISEDAKSQDKKKK